MFGQTRTRNGRGVRNSIHIVWRALWTLASVLPVNAGGFEDAEAAVNSGDYVTALRLDLADQDNTYAERLLGIMYIKGRGVRRTTPWESGGCELRRTRGWRTRRMRLGFCINEAGGPSETSRGGEWFRLAADQGLVLAQNNLADTYVGIGVPQDLAKPSSGIASLDQSSSYAENVIGVAYEHGLHVAQDYTEAFRWYRRAETRLTAAR